MKATTFSTNYTYMHDLFVIHKENNILRSIVRNIESGSFYA